MEKIKLPRGVFTRKQFAKLNDDKLRKLFREVDIDESGSLTIEEFMEFLQRRFGVRPTKEILMKILKEIDDNNDGNIDEEEFL